MNKIKISPKGFTLIELLVVVLIIGVLTAVALPGYRKAVEKSRVTDALNTMQAVAKSEHGWYLMNSDYTKDFAKLDINLTDKDGHNAVGESFESIDYTYQLAETGIIAERNNGEYFIYKDYATNQILCSPGTHYICEDLGTFSKTECENIEMAWANRNSTCYVDEEARCNGLYPDDEFWQGTYCGYTSTSSTTVNEGMTCMSNGTYQCSNTIINDGGVCRGRGYYACQEAIVNYGGKCMGGLGGSSGYTNQCQNSIINNGGRCISNGAEGCTGSTINAGGICEGNACTYLTINGGECSATGNRGCWGSTVTAGGICSGTCARVTVINGGECTGNCIASIVNEGGICSGTCAYTTINTGGICKSSATNSCKNNTYSGTGCCCGDYCGSKPKCVDMNISCD